MQISFAVIAKLISAFVFATRTVQFLYFLNPKFPASNHLLSLYIPVCVRPGLNPNCWFSHAQAHLPYFFTQVSKRKPTTFVGVQQTPRVVQATRGPQVTTRKQTGDLDVKPYRLAEADGKYQTGGEIWGRFHSNGGEIWGCFHSNRVNLSAPGTICLCCTLHVKQVSWLCFMGKFKG